MTRSNIISIDTHRVAQLAAARPRGGVDDSPGSTPVDLHACLAMPSARAGQVAPRAVLRRLGHTVPIAIAVLSALYFGAQLIRGVL